MKLALRLAISLFIIFAAVLPSQEKVKIAITFDDLPIGGKDPGISQIEKMTNDLLETLKKHGIQAIGFVNEGKLSKNDQFPQRKAILLQWLKAGQELGNHTYSHPDYHRTDFKNYSADILKGETTLKEINPEGREKWFRHPMLRNGNTAEKKKLLRQFLLENHYRVAPVTIENDDYIFAYVYAHALADGDEEKAAFVKKEYMAFTASMFAFFEEAALTLFGRQINHVLLLHANQLNAACMEDICKIATSRGYQFTTLIEVLEDKAYESPDNWTGNAGTNWLFRWDYSLNSPKKVDWSKQPVPSEKIMSLYRALLSSR